MKSLCLFLMIGILSLFFAGNAHADWFRDKLQASHFELRGGYGSQYNNANLVRRLQFISILPSLAVPLTDEIGSSFWRGQWEWAPEGNLVLFVNPVIRGMGGITPLQFRYVFHPEAKISPYLMGGAGIVWTNLNRPETGTRFNFNSQGAGGFRYRLTDSVSLIAEYRYMHVSNAGISNRNRGLSTHNFIGGISIRR